MDAYIIIGEAEVGKSSLIRALTGIRNDDERLISLRGGPDFQLWAKDSSLQEASVEPRDFISEATGKMVDAVLCALWPKSRRSKGVTYPDELGYLQAFHAAGWTIQPIVVLAKGGNHPTVRLPVGVTSTNFSNIRTSPFNSFSASVRLHWGWN